MTMKCFVTGGAGFIGSHLVDGLLEAGHQVSVFDNLSTGSLRFLSKAQENPNFAFVEGDCCDQEALMTAMAGHDSVFHLAANADVRFGTKYPRRDLEQNTIATFQVLEAARANGVQRFMFSSTGAIYGETKTIPTPEDAPFPVQTSLYGASKLAGEGMIQAYAEGFGIKAFIFRFVSILGERYGHGHVYDFYKKLRDNPESMDVLGNGKQKKSYLYVKDCVDAIILAVENAQDLVNIYNLGTDQVSDVNNSLRVITERMGIQPTFNYEDSDRGWIGDNPYIYLDTTRIQSLGWKPTVSINDGILRTLEYLIENPWLLESRT